MGLFAGARRRKMAERLISLGEMCSTMATIQLVEMLPKEGNLSVKEASRILHFWATIAAVGLGMWITTLSLGISKRYREIKKLEKALAKQLDAWNGRGGVAYSDLLRTIFSETAEGVAVERATATWLVWNVKRSEPTEKELAMGEAVCAMFFVQMGVELGLDKKTTLALLGTNLGRAGPAA